MLFGSWTWIPSTLYCLAVCLSIFDLKKLDGSGLAADMMYWEHGLRRGKEDQVVYGNGFAGEDVVLPLDLAANHDAPRAEVSVAEGF
jgi:hypothetical protein